MTTWASEMTEYRDSAGATLPNVRKYVFDVTSDADGQFAIDLTSLALNYVCDVTCFCVGQALTPATDVTSILIPRAVAITNTAIAGVLVRGNSVSISIGLLLKTILRGGAGITVRVVVAAY